MMEPHLDANTTSSTQDISTVGTNGDTSSTRDSLSAGAVSDTNIVEVTDSVASVADITTAARNTDSSDDMEVVADVEAGVDSKSYTDESVDSESVAVGSVDGDDNSDAGKLNSNAVISNNSDPIVRKSQVPNLEERSKVYMHILLHYYNATRYKLWISILNFFLKIKLNSI